MKKISQICIIGLCAFVVATGVITCGWKDYDVFAEDKETPHVQKSTPTGSLMRIINSHTAKMLEAIMIGDFDVVVKKSHEVVRASEVIMRMFFPEGGKVEEWFHQTGKDPNDPEAVKAMKVEFEKFAQITIDASRKIAEVSGNNNIVETYESFNAMIENACFSCHKISRLKWPQAR